MDAYETPVARDCNEIEREPAWDDARQAINRERSADLKVRYVCLDTYPGVRGMPQEDVPVVMLSLSFDFTSCGDSPNETTRQLINGIRDYLDRVERRLQ